MNRDAAGSFRPPRLPPPAPAVDGGALFSAFRWSASRSRRDLVHLAALLPTPAAVAALARALDTDVLRNAAASAFDLAKAESDVFLADAGKAQAALVITLNRFLLAYVEVFALSDQLVARRNLGYAHLCASRSGGDDAEAFAALGHFLTVAADPAISDDLAEQVARDIAAAMLESPPGVLGPILERLEQDFKPLAERFTSTSTPSAHLNSGLGILAFARWEAGLDPHGLDTAAERLSQAVASTPSEHEEHPGTVANFAAVQMMQAQTIGEPQLVSDAIEALQQAAQHLPPTHRWYAKIQMNLSSALRHRSWSYQNSGDASAAAEAAERAFGATRARLAASTPSLTDLRDFARYAHQLLDHTADSDQATAIETALCHYEAQLADALAEHPQIAGHVDSLRAAILQRRAIAHQRSEDLSAAARLLDRAADVAASGSEALARVRRLGEVQEQLAKLAPSWEAWLALGDTAQRALNLAGQLSPTENCVELHNCSYTWMQIASWHISNGGDTADLQEIVDAALTFALEAIASSGLSAFRRLENAVATASAMEVHWFSHAALLWEQAALLLPAAAPWFLGPADRERVLDRFGSLPAIAAEALLVSGQPEATARVLHLLDTSSFVFIGSHRRLRATWRLVQGHADLLERFGPVMQELLDGESWIGQSGEALRARFRLQQALEELERELARRAFNETRVDRENTSQQTMFPTVHLVPGRHHLFAVSAQPVPFALKLPATAPDLKQVAKRVFTIAEAEEAPPSPEPGEPAQMLDAMHWAGDRIVGPVLDACGLQPGSPESPRVHWIPHGDFAALPLHAAVLPRPQHPSSAVTRYAIDDYLFTYGYAPGPVFESLGPPMASRGATLLVGATVTKHDPLNAVDDELKAVVKAFGAHDVAELKGAAVTKAAVLQALPLSRVLHWAGHTELDVDHPADHTLETADGGLALGQVLQLSLEHLELANLSACHTTVNGTSKLQFEALSLAAAFHLAGAKQVVGTLWSVYDLAAMRFNQAFYRHLCNDQGQPSLDAASVALRDATLELRRIPSLEGKPEIWGAFHLLTSTPVASSAWSFPLARQ